LRVVAPIVSEGLAHRRDERDGLAQGHRLRVGMVPAQPEGVAHQHLDGLVVGTEALQPGHEPSPEGVVRARRRPNYEPGRFDDEGPAHRVRLTRRFAMLGVPVTNAMYALFDPSRAGGAEADHPVVKVTWAEVTALANWLDVSARLSRRPARGPTAARPFTSASTTSAR